MKHEISERQHQHHSGQQRVARRVGIRHRQPCICHRRRHGTRGQDGVHQPNDQRRADSAVDHDVGEIDGEIGGQDSQHRQHDIADKQKLRQRSALAARLEIEAGKENTTQYQQVGDWPMQQQAAKCQRDPRSERQDDGEANTLLQSWRMRRPRQHLYREHRGDEGEWLVARFLESQADSHGQRQTQCLATGFRGECCLRWHRSAR